MNTVSKSYTLVWEIPFAPEYQWTKCGKCFNTKTGKELRQVYNKGSIGYNIRGRFRSLKALRPELRVIVSVKCPF
jgi:hypothetical protein